MALMLAMYQKMRLIREKNQATLDVTKYSSKVNRVAKNIERVQKMFTSRKAKLDAQAKMMTSRAKTIFQQMSGLTVNNPAYLTNYGGYMNGGYNSSNNAYVIGQLNQFLNKGVPVQWDAESNSYKPTTDGSTTPFGDINKQQLLQLYQSGVLSRFTLDEATNKYKYSYKDNNNTEQTIEYSKQDFELFGMCTSVAQQNYMMANMQLNQASTDYEQNVSIWLEAATTQLEEEQDAALEPLNYEQTMLELEKEQAEMKLKRIEAELQSYTQLCDKEAQNMAPKFGL